MNIGRFYLKEKKYTAALNRFKIVIEDYSMTKFTPEALHRMVEAYYEMGMIDESVKTASTFRTQLSRIQNGINIVII